MDYTRKGNAFGKGVTFRWWADDRWSPLQQRGHRGSYNSAPHL